MLRFITDPSRKENSLTNGATGAGGCGGLKGSLGSSGGHNGGSLTASSAGGGADSTAYQSTPPGTPGSITSSSLHGGGSGGLGGGGGGTTGSGTGGNTGTSADGKLAAAGSAGTDMKRKIAIKHHSYSMSSSNRSTTPTGRFLGNWYLDSCIVF